MKGILFTAMLATIALVVLTLATAYLVYNARTNAALDKTIVFYAMTEEYNTIERLVSDVLSLHNYTFDIEENNATVNYFFPATPPPARNALSNNVSFLWRFLENISEFETTIDLSYLNGTGSTPGNISLRFYPENTTLDSIGGIGSNRLEVRKSRNVLAYDIFIDADVGGNMAEDPTTVKNVGTSWPVILTVNGRTNFGDQSGVFDETLEGDKNSTINITVGDYYFIFNVSSLSGDNRTLTIQKYGNFDANLRLTTSFNTSEMVEIVLDKESINMTVSQYYIRKSGNIRVG